MSYEKLIEDLRNYCKLYYPDIQDIEVVEMGLLEKNGTILNSRTRLRLNHKIDFDYIGGTPFQNYNKYFEQV